MDETQNQFPQGDEETTEDTGAVEGDTTEAPAEGGFGGGDDEVVRPEEGEGEVA